VVVEIVTGVGTVVVAVEIEVGFAAVVETVVGFVETVVVFAEIGVEVAVEAAEIVVVDFLVVLQIDSFHYSGNC